MFDAYKNPRMKNEHEANAVTFILLGSAILAVAASFYLNFFTKQFEYLVEAPCNSTKEECYVRDCDAEECPPNGLSEYALYAVQARHFQACTDNSCTNVCEATGQCTPILCSEQSEVECSTGGVL